MSPTFQKKTNALVQNIKKGGPLRCTKGGPLTSGPPFLYFKQVH